MKILNAVIILLVLGTFISCTGKSNKNSVGEHQGHDMATHGENVAAGHQGHNAGEEMYTCPMHPQIKSNKPGNCPICGMKLVPMEMGGAAPQTSLPGLTTLLQPTNEYVISSIPVTTIQYASKEVTLDLLGSIVYDNTQAGNISARVSGRIEKLYVRSRFQSVKKGQRIMDIYSPEILTAEENLLMLLKNDPSNQIMINAAKQKLLLLGMSSSQLENVIRKRKPDFTISVYSNYNGYIRDAGQSMGSSETQMNNQPIQLSRELSVREGMYLQKGQTVFTVYNPSKVWALLNVYSSDQSLVKRGQSVTLIPEVSPESRIIAKVTFVEPFFRPESKTFTVRVPFNNSAYKLPIGSQVRASVHTGRKYTNWLPKNAVISLGMDNVVFRKSGSGFVAQKIKTGISVDKDVEITDGLTSQDTIAINAQYLMDSESFIKTTSKK